MVLFHSEVDETDHSCTRSSVSRLHGNGQKSFFKSYRPETSDWGGPEGVFEQCARAHLKDFVLTGTASRLTKHSRLSDRLPPASELLKIKKTH